MDLQWLSGTFNLVKTELSQHIAIVNESTNIQFAYNKGELFGYKTMETTVQRITLH